MILFGEGIVRLAEQIYPYLERYCRGNNNALPYSDLHMQEDDTPGFVAYDFNIKCTRREFRRACKAMLRVLGHPVISCGHGIFVAETQEEINGFIADQKSRAGELYANAEAAEKCSPARRVDNGFFGFVTEEKCNG